ncbi:nitrous oxide reductase family maturation protein NosD [Thermoflexus sp.]|uniref:nitrous oxide reductase family maturation protein NosD n=1 Tax=Thermoflexus sp. TaxID=1969742 RepID=UPI0035E4133C
MMRPLALALWTLTVVAPGDPDRTLQEAIAAAPPGATLEVHGGIYYGPFQIDKPLTLIGVDGPVLDGRGRGTVLRIRAPHVTVRGFVIRNSGRSLEHEDAGILVEGAAGVTLEGNHLEDVLFGIYLKDSPGGRIRNNTVIGLDVPEAERGDAIRLWYSPDAWIEGNRTWRGRDVIIWFSDHSLLRGNRFEGGRYGIHYMYCNGSEVGGNTLQSNFVGVFVMYSRGLVLRDNRFLHQRGPSGYGLAFKDSDDIRVEGNLFLDNTAAIFLDNTPREEGSPVRFERNIIAYNGIGVLALPMVRGVVFRENVFWENEQQAGTQGEGNLMASDWRGNFWSDYAGFDADGDGVGDVPYRSRRVFEAIADRVPLLRLFWGTPAMQALESAAILVPFFEPQIRLEDPAPRIRLPARAPERASGNAGGWIRMGLGGLLLAAAWWGWLRRSPRPSWGEGKRTVPEAILEVRGLRKRFGRTWAVRGLDLLVRPGEAVALWGPNGAGKTTVLRCILGLLDYEGTIRVAGRDVRKEGPAARRWIGYVPQELAFYSHWTVAETLGFFAALRGVAVDPTQVEALGLTPYQDQPVRALSGGLKQRLALALALMGDPPILLLDEPTANLDLTARMEWRSWLRELKAQGKTLLFSSHRLEEVQGLADRVVVMRAGQVIGEVPPEALGEVAGLRARLRLSLPPAELERARQVLEASGYPSFPNGHGLILTVPADRKLTPVRRLWEAGIAVLDLDIEWEREE